MKIIKKAFTLIEVVLTIVVIAIAVSAVPFIIMQVNKSTDFSIMQEALFGSATKMFSIFTYRWDENSSDDPNNPLFVQAINTNGDNELADIGEGLRVGHIKSNGRKKFFTLEERNATAKINFGRAKGVTRENDVDSGFGIYDDVDDFDGENFLVSVVTQGSVDYKNDLNISSTVKYISDTADYNNSTINFTLNTTEANNTTNIKLIEINATTLLDNQNFTFTLNGFVCNIGESDLYHRIK